MARRRLRRRREKGQRHRPYTAEAAGERLIVREATRVERLAYTRTQAAQALGISRSTFDRWVLPLIETLEMDWGRRLIPVDELGRLLAERRQQAQQASRPPARPGRSVALPPAVVARIRDEHERGRSLGEIARGLDADGVSTAQGGRRWWPSTVRAILTRSRPPEAA